MPPLRAFVMFFTILYNIFIKNKQKLRVNLSLAYGVSSLI